MRLSTYLQKTYLLLFVSIGIGLTVLFNLIEFIEKVLHTKAPFMAIMHFILLNLAPSWLTLLPITCWLAMVATIYHLQSCHEWYVCQLLGITAHSLVKSFWHLLLVIMMVIMGAKHIALDALSWQAQQAYQATFSRGSTASLSNQWCHINRQQSGVIGSFNQQTGTGTDLHLYRYTKVNHLEHLLYAPTFTVVDTLFYAQQATQWHIPSGKKTIQRPWIKQLPTLAAILSAPQPTHSLLDYLCAWWHSNDHAQRVLLTQRITDDIQPLIFSLSMSLLTLLLYLLIYTHLSICLLAYPTILFISMTLQAVTGYIPLANSMICIIAIGALFALAKAKKSRILKSVA